MRNPRCKIYVLKLIGQRWYVGKCADVRRRMRQHFALEGCVWTSRFPPIGLYRVYRMRTRYDEDMYTKMYMNRYGIDNVRGGSYCQWTLPQSVKKLLDREFCTAHDLCFRCGQWGHFANACFYAA